MNEVGEYIRKLRTEKGLTQEQLGKMVGVQKAAVQKWENGSTTNLKRATIKKLSEIFKVSPVTFVSTDRDEIVEHRLYLLEQEMRNLGVMVYAELDNGYMWLDFPDGTLEITQDDLNELQQNMQDYLNFKLTELKIAKRADYKLK